ncbi:MAG: hypothetical protein LQ341_003199, partial [Variospora aurantia]
MVSFPILSKTHSKEKAARDARQALAAVLEPENAHYILQIKPTDLAPVGVNILKKFVHHFESTTTDTAPSTLADTSTHAPAPSAENTLMDDSAGISAEITQHASTNTNAITSTGAPASISAATSTTISASILADASPGNPTSIPALTSVDTPRRQASRAYLTAVSAAARPPPLGLLRSTPTLRSPTNNTVTKRLPPSQPLGSATSVPPPPNNRSRPDTYDAILSTTSFRMDESLCEHLRLNTTHDPKLFLGPSLPHLNGAIPSIENFPSFTRAVNIMPRDGTIASARRLFMLHVVGEIAAKLFDPTAVAAQEALMAAAYGKFTASVIRPAVQDGGAMVWLCREEVFGNGCLFWLLAGTLGRSSGGTSEFR